MSLLSGIDLPEIDQTIRAQDDLYRHMNEQWLSRTEIPSDQARYGAFLVLRDEAEQAVREIIDAAAADPKSDEERKIGELYASFMDDARADALGAKPIERDLALAASVSDIASLVKAVGQFERQGLGGFFDLDVEADPGDPASYIVFASQGGIGLPDESYYRDEKFAAVRDAYQKHLERMFALAGVDDPARGARLVFELETAIAASHWDIVKSRDIQKLYNVKSFAELQALMPELDWPTYLVAADIPRAAVDTLVVAQPEALAGVSSLLTDDRLEAWRYWLAWQVIRGSASLLSTDFVEANFDFYGRTLSGTPEMRERWKRGVSLVQGVLGEAVGKVYVEQHFPPTAKQRMDELVANLIAAYHQSISTITWMTDATKEKALEKLAKFTPKIGYPVKWRDYSTLAIVPGDLIANAREAARFEQARELAKLGKPVDRDEWFMTPQTINAYYNPMFNEIVFPAAILQPPFFNADADDAANYGAIGGVIGHEIGHGFDDQGSRFDGDGALVEWWTPEDREAFEKLTHALIAQYDALEPDGADGHHVNGALTIGENIGDLGGIAIAWKAYVHSLNGAEPPVIDGLTGAERFFLSWAKVWQEKRRPAEVVRLLSIDPHSPNEFRCNQIAKNIDVFHSTFGVKPGDGMWLAPDERVKIW